MQYYSPKKHHTTIKNTNILLFLFSLISWLYAADQDQIKLVVPNSSSTSTSTSTSTYIIYYYYYAALLRIFGFKKRMKK
jgi:hypothetical protein